MPIEGKFYTAKEVAAIYHVDERTVRRWIQGELEGTPIPHGHLVSQQALDKFVRPKRGKPKR